MQQLFLVGAGAVCLRLTCMFLQEATEYVKKYGSSSVELKAGMLVFLACVHCDTSELAILV